MKKSPERQRSAFKHNTKFIDYNKDAGLLQDRDTVIYPHQDVRTMRAPGYNELQAQRNITSRAKGKRIRWKSANYPPELQITGLYLIASDVKTINPSHKASGYLYFVKPYE